jgi:hypothetical protein
MSVTSELSPPGDIVDGIVCSGPGGPKGARAVGFAVGVLAMSLSVWN